MPSCCTGRRPQWAGHMGPRSPSSQMLVPTPPSPCAPGSLSLSHGPSLPSLPGLGVKKNGQRKGSDIKLPTHARMHTHIRTHTPGSPCEPSGPRIRSGGKVP